MARAGSTSIGVAAGALVIALLARSDGLVAQVPAPAPAATNAATSAALTRYCATCHNDRLKTGGFVLDLAALSDVGAHADDWEKVVRKLRTESMPPPGAPRPDAATYRAVAGFLEAQLDRAAAARPQLGALPLAHRLSRTEYSNAIRDLLA